MVDDQLLLWLFKNKLSVLGNNITRYNPDIKIVLFG